MTEVSNRGSMWRALSRSRLGLLAVLMLAAFVVLAILAPIALHGSATTQNVDAIQQGASGQHLFGTDALGRDLLARTLVATRLSLILAVAAAALGVLGGLVLGVASLLMPSRLGKVMVALIDIAVAFPPLLLALFFAIIFGVGITGAILAIAVAIAPSFARLTHTLATSVAGLDFVDAARISGVGRFRMLYRHVLPNIADPLAVNISLIAGDALLAFASLSFLGIGVQAPRYDWGRIFNDGLSLLYVNPMASLGPGLAILLAGLAFNLLGEACAQIAGGRGGGRGGVKREPVSVHVDDVSAERSTAAIRVSNLSVNLPIGRAWLRPVRGVSFEVCPGQSVGLVGESGSGKSMTAMALAQLIEEPAVIDVDRLDFAGTSLIGLSSQHRRSLLGTRLAVVFQDPMTSFNPSQKIGTQLAEVARAHSGLSRSKAWKRAVGKLDSVRISSPAQRASQYPHEFSGGMRQRAMIAMGLMGEPTMIIADEPTTALDVTVQQQVLDLLDEAKGERAAALILISHDIDLVARHCDRVLVMYAGRIVEDMPASALSSESRHPYTRALRAAVPDFETDRDLPLAVIPGRPPRLTEVGSGCAFAPRCINATERCHVDDPELVSVTESHRLACWHPVESQSSAYELSLIERTDIP